MGKKKGLYTGSKHEGVHITYYRAGGMVEVGGWFDGFVELGDESFSLVEFLTKIGLKAKEVAGAAEEMRVSESEERKAKRLARKRAKHGVIS